MSGLPSRSRSDSTPRRRAAWGLAILILGAAVVTGLVRSGATGTAGGAGGAGAAGAIVLEPEARGALSRLWEASIDANEEQVACLGGELRGGRVHVSRVEPIPYVEADSVRVQARPSLDRCGPPAWLGTVHTHILEVGGRPAPGLSAPDRAVIHEWRARWRAEGLFCVVYSATRAACEYGSSVANEIEYAEPADATASGPQ